MQALTRVDTAPMPAHLRPNDNAVVLAGAPDLFAAPPSAVPMGLGHKCRAFVGLAAHEPAYRRNVSAMFVAENAAALSNAGYLLMLQACATGGDAAAAAMVMDLTRTASGVVALHQRDNEDLVVSPDSPRSKRAQLARNIALHGVGETACNIAILGCLAATGLRPENAALTRAVTLSMQVGKTYLSTRYFGLWSCLKVHLGDAAARAKQRDYNRTIGAFEFIVFSLFSRTGGTALYLKARQSFHGSPTDLLAPAVGVMTAAGALSLAFNANFVMQSGQVDAPAPPPPVAAEAAELLGLGAKLRAFASLLACDPDYRRHALALLSCRFGLGLISVGYLQLMNQSGSPLDVALIGMAEDFVRFGGFLIAHHERDNEDLARATAGVPERRAQLSTSLAFCAVPDTLGAAGILAGLGLSVHNRQHPLFVRAALAGAKITDTYVRNRESGYWNCIKVYLGDEAARQRQSAINRTIGSLENAALTLMSSAVSIGVYLLLNTEAGKNTHKTDYACIAAVSMGLLFTAVGRGFFAREAVKGVPRIYQRAESPSEITPLLRAASP